VATSFVLVVFWLLTANQTWQSPDYTLLQGEWREVATEMNGAPVNALPRIEYVGTLQITGRHFERFQTLADGKVLRGGSGSFVLDSSQNPSTIDFAIYLLGYFSVRAGHRMPDGQLAIYTGSQMSARIFAQAICLEQLLRDRPIEDPGMAFEALLADARTSQRPVLVALGLKSCLPCRQLERFLEEQQITVSRYFAVLKADVDDENSPGVLIRDRYRTRYETDGYTNYFPWIAFLNGDGELLVTSDDGPESQIGIPQGGPKDRAWFLRMLRIANPAITDGEIAKLDVAAEAFHELIWISDPHQD
jgi:uncharacterized protein (TIGR03067 family)